MYRHAGKCTLEALRNPLRRASRVSEILKKSLENIGDLLEE
jgi:hypothetical protein